MSLIKCSRDLYEYGNHCGKVLANALRKQRVGTYVPSVKIRQKGTPPPCCEHCRGIKAVLKLPV